MVHVQSLWLQNFRNYKEQEIVFGLGTTVIFGDNGQGKTNLIEAINYLGTAASFRGVPTEALIRDTTEAAIIRGEVIHEQRNLLVEAEISKTRQNSIAVNKQKIRPIRNLVGLIPIPIFGPDDLSLVKAGPSERRNYIDNLLIQIHPQNMKTRMDLESVLKQRNALLKQAKGRLNKEQETTLDIWTTQFDLLAHQWAEKRKNTLIALAESVKNAYEELAGKGKEPNLIYQPDWFQKGLKTTLHSVQNDEIRRGTTLIGPHRDEITIELGGMAARTHASQGEQRTIALALRVAGHQLLKETHKTKPVLLLDDVFSELDDTRTKALLELFVADQTFITTAINPEKIPTSNYLYIKNGEIEEK